MITPDEIKEKILRVWNSGAFLKAWCKGENIFPISFPTGLPGGSYLSANFNEVKLWIDNLVSRSKEKTGKGYVIRFSTVSHRQLGRQNIPERVLIEEPADFLSISGKTKDFSVFKEVYSFTKDTLPELTDFMQENPLVSLSHAATWNKLIKTCLYFRANPKPAMYLRQIVIAGIDTKFIERNKKILSELLLFLMPEVYGTEPFELSYHGFEKRFGLLYDQPLVRFRILDADRFINSLSDITLTLSEFASLDPDMGKIFITENKINGLAFPMVKNSMVIFGLGYGIKSLENISWIKSKKIYYWGDIDTHGFGILSIVRGIFPQCISLLMDEETLLSHKDAWTVESDNRRCTNDLDNLNESEKELYDKLRNNSLGENTRLEQELVSFDLLCSRLAGLD